MRPRVTLLLGCMGLKLGGTSVAAPGAGPHTMAKLFLCVTALATGLTLPSVAGAQSAPSSCPPGSWFCVQPPQAEAAPAGSPVQPSQQAAAPSAASAPQPAPGAPAQPSPVQVSPPTARPEPPYPPLPPGGPPGPPGYGPPPPPYEYQLPPGARYARPGAPPPYAYPYLPEYEVYSPPPPPLPFREWGLNVHLAAAAIGRGVGGNAGMAGAGLGLRFKPTPRFGIEADVDYFGGTDYSGNSRGETALSLNGLLFVNPRSRAQAYFLAGLGGSTAHVSCDPSNGCEGAPSTPIMDISAARSAPASSFVWVASLRSTPTFAAFCEREWIRGRRTTRSSSTRSGAARTPPRALCSPRG